MQRRNTLRGLIALIGAAAVTSACGSSGSFGLTSDDNNQSKLKAAFAMMTKPAAGPRNATGKPLAFLVTRRQRSKKIPRKLVAYDLQSNKELWRVEADVSSRVAVGRAFVAHRQGERSVVARDVTTGKQLWSKSVSGEFLGLTADTKNVYYVTKTTSGKATWNLVAVSGASGAQLWAQTAPGQLGQPAARGGLVFSPFLNQWLAILDAKTGKQVTRIRGIDEQISFVRATSERIYYGSKFGVFLLDDNAYTGKRAQSTYGKAELPKQFVRPAYYWDAFDPIQTKYTAYDSNRILWRGHEAGGKLHFAQDQVVVLTYRFFFAFGSEKGKLRWAYNNPRNDAVGAEHTGKVIAFATTAGHVGALDPRTGKRVYFQQTEGPISGVTFDADGWQPNDPAAAQKGTSTVQALASIARDRDARFNQVKKFAITALAELPGAEVTRDLIALIQNPRTPQALYAKAVEVLVARKDAKGLRHLVEVLEVKHDFIAGNKPKTIGVAARAIGAMAKQKLDAAERGKAVQALLYHMRSPQTSADDLVHVIRALGAIGGGAELQPLRSFLLAYRADPTFSKQVGAVSATIDVLLEHGAARERELVAFVAGDARTQKSIRTYASRALKQTAQ
jgi:outer membrane protein assembly factor BamB